MILAKQDIANIDIDLFLDDKLRAGKVDQILFIVPTKRKIRYLTRELISFSQNKAVSGLKIETIGSFAEKLLTEIDGTVNQVSEQASILLLSHSFNRTKLRYFSQYKEQIPFGTLERIKNVISEYFTTAPDGKLYQLPDQQFANLYWFRADLFDRADLKEKFKKKYGYDLGVPLNWSAYEDIAAFFTNDVKEIDGKPIYGHMDYGKKDPSLGWRFTDAWLSMAGTADIGIPNGMPVDEWGIRVADDKCTPVGASVSRGGATNSPAAVYALTKYVDWMKKFAPKEATGMTFGEAGPVPAQGQIAQQIFWYTAFTADMVKPGLPVVNADGTPKWRMAPGPNGPYWKQGMQNGYQDVGSWTFFADHDANKTAAAWLYAQFITSKTVSPEEDHRGPDADPRKRHPEPGDDRHGAQAGWPGRVLPQPGAGGLDADRHQRSRLPEAGAAVVEERGAGGDRRDDAAEGDGHAGRRDGRRDGPARTCRHGQVPAQAQPQGRPGEVPERQGRAVEEAGQ